MLVSTFEAVEHAAGAIDLSPSILVVEDDDSVRKSLLRTLSARGFTATGARNGKEALLRAAADPPDVIIMDLQLPVMSGSDAARALRQHPALASVPIIALSATLEDATTELFFRLLTKPCSTDTLLAAIAEAIETSASSGCDRGLQD